MRGEPVSRKGAKVFRLAVSRRRTRIDSHVSRKEDGESLSRSEEVAGQARALKGDVVGLNAPKSPLVGFAVAGLGL